MWITPASVIGGVASIDRSEFHTYRFAGMGNTLDVFIDDVFAQSLTAGPSGGSFVLQFGDLNTQPKGNSTSQWDYFSVSTVPEPATLAFLVMGLLILGFRSLPHCDRSG